MILGVYTKKWIARFLQSSKTSFFQVNINSLLLKIEDLRSIACLSNAAVIGVAESKSDNSIFDSEIEIDSYNILRFDRNRRRGSLLWEKWF